MDQNKINRINELARKSKAEGLSAEEKLEQGELRAEYRMSVLGNLSSTLQNVQIKEPDGTIHDLKQKKHH